MTFGKVVKDYDKESFTRILYHVNHSFVKEHDKHLLKR